MDIKPEDAVFYAAPSEALVESTTKLHIYQAAQIDRYTLRGAKPACGKRLIKNSYRVTATEAPEWAMCEKCLGVVINRRAKQ